MFILKQPKVGGEVATHQDATFLFTEPTENKLIGLWLALDDCTAQNGCLQFIPGSHRRGLINGRRMVRASGENAQNFGASADNPYSVHSGGSTIIAFLGGATTCDGEFVSVACGAGALVLINGLVVHRSDANRSDKPRNAYAWHVIETHDCTWSAQNWLQPSANLAFLKMYEYDEAARLTK